MPTPIAVGSTLPEATFTTSQNQKEEGACAIPTILTTSQVFGGKRVVLFAVPGAFTPSCHVQHLPGFLDEANYAAIKAKGVDTIACLATNDVFVLDAWGKSFKSGDRILFLADGSANFVKAIGLDLDLTAKGMGVRSQRFVMIVKDGVVEHLAVGGVEVSGAEAVLAKL
ncbi:Redoxin [Entophlyctis helioformis]|nr:Redoxin [Entophlyctis helioformis]